MKKAFVLGGFFVTLLSVALLGGCPPLDDNGFDDDGTGDNGLNDGAGDNGADDNGVENGGGNGSTDDLVAGQTLYDNRCAACHSLGTYDTTGAANLSGKAGQFEATLAPGQVGITLTAQSVRTSPRSPPSTGPPWR